MKNEEASRINTAAQEYAMEAIPLTREIWEEAYRDGRRAEYYHQITVISAKDKEIELLKATLHIDQTGLAKGLAAVNKLVDSYWWVTEGRGPYKWNDDRYKDEMRIMLEGVSGIATKALNSSATIAHSICCRKEMREATIDDIGYVKKEWADKEIERLKALLQKSIVENALSWLEGPNAAIIAAKTWENFKTEHNL